MHKKDLVAFGYRKVEHGGLSWLADEDGTRFLTSVREWSANKLPDTHGWSYRKKSQHSVYLVRNHGGKGYLIKDYPPEHHRRRLFGGKANRAKKEFARTLLAYRKGIQTVLPLAVGEENEDKDRGVIIYPFLDKAIPLERAYQHEHLNLLSIRDRQCLEKEVGKLLRKMVDAGAYPVDGHLDHFLVMRTDEGKILVYYIDLERVEFSSLTKKWLMRRKLIKTLGRLLARLEWLRVSGGGIRRAGMMRISRAFFGQQRLGRLNRELSMASIQAARKYWHRREFHKRGSYGLRSYQLSR